MAAAEFVPEKLTPSALREAAAHCQACELWQGTTQTVFGEGPVDARVMLVGEQPGDREDREGHPFVGPAGRVLFEALNEVGLDPRIVYITNVVKHFRYRARGKRRIHQKPDAAHIAACRPWLDAELELVRPEALVCLGAVAAQTLLGRGFRVTRERGRVLDTPYAAITLATVHPSSVLRTRDDTQRRNARQAFTDDLRIVAQALKR